MGARPVHCAAEGVVLDGLDRLQARGVITGYGPEIDPAALGHAVTAFVTLEIRQAGGHDQVAGRLAMIAEVLEVHTITGAGDMLCRVVARTNSDLQRVIDALVDVPGVVRASTVIALATPVGYRVLPLVRTVTESASRGKPDRPAAAGGEGQAGRGGGAGGRPGAGGLAPARPQAAGRPGDRARPCRALLVSGDV